MLKKVLVVVLAIFVMPCAFAKGKDTRSKELKYQYEVLKQDEKSKMEGKIFNLVPSGYMTVEEYEALSEYKEKANIQPDIPKFQTPSDFKYVPKPLYRIVKYNDPPGSVELKLGKRLYLQRQVNAQGIVSPDYSMMVYPAVYYYTDSASVACDLFIIPLEDGDTNLNKILKANVAKKISTPILSTDKSIDNYAAFRTLTPVDFSVDGTKLLIKQKLGSREDGIWETSIFVYDFNNKIDYDLSEIRDAIVYFWQEYMDLNLDEKRWDIYPIGFDKENPDRVIVQAFAFTGERPVFLGTWSVDWQGNQSRIVSFNKNVDPIVSINGYKVIQDGIEDYQAVQNQEKAEQKQSKYLKKQCKQNYNDHVKQIKNEYEFAIKELDKDYKDEYRDYKKLRSLSGSTENSELQEAYKKYLIDQLNKDIKNNEKQIEKYKKEIEKIDNKLEKLYTQNGETSDLSDEPENSSSDIVGAD